MYGFKQKVRVGVLILEGWPLSPKEQPEAFSSWRQEWLLARPLVVHCFCKRCAVGEYSWAVWLWLARKTPLMTPLVIKRRLSAQRWGQRMCYYLFLSSLPLIYIYLCDLPLANTNQPKWKRKRNTEIGESLGLSHSLKCSLNGLDMSSVRMMPVEWNAVWPWRLTEQDGDRGIFRRHGGTVKDMKSLGWNK